MEKLRKTIDAYNKKAVKWGYDVIALEGSSIRGAFVPKVQTTGSLFAQFKAAYRNGYLEEDYNNIINRLNKITSTI